MQAKLPTELKTLARLPDCNVAFALAHSPPVGVHSPQLRLHCEFIQDGGLHMLRPLARYGQMSSES